MADDLTDTEQALWDAILQGQPADLEDSAIRAEVIVRFLLSGHEQANAIRLRGAHITGTLDLSYTEVRHPLIMTDCRFDEAPLLTGARTVLVDLSCSRLPGLQARDSRIDGNLRLAECTLAEPIRLSGAHVSGTLDLTGSEIHGDPALLADSLTVGSDLVCRDLQVHGEALMWSTRVSGTMVLEGAQFGRPGGAGITGDGLVVDGGLFAGRGFRSQGRMSLQDARIGRRCALSGARLTHPGGVALDAERLTVDGSLLLDDGLTVEGEVVLRAATIRGSLHLAGAVFRHAEGVALNAPLMEIGSGLLGTPGFTAEGTVMLDATNIRDSISLGGAVLTSPGGTALSARRIDVTGSLYCGGGFQAEGEIVLSDARIGARVEFHGARLTNPGSRALTAWGLSAGGTFVCCDGFTADGTVSLSSSQIGNDLCFEDSTINGDLLLRSVRAASFRCGPHTILNDTVDLRHAHVSVIADDHVRWPDHVRLDGLTYDGFETPLSVRDRLDWLARDPHGYHPQPYEQLASVYRRHGNETAAREVLLVKHRCRRSALPRPARIWDLLQDVTVGYGFRPLRATTWLIALLALATTAFALTPPPPLKPAEAPPFDPFLYSLDLLVPIISFGQESAYAPHGAHQWLAALLIAAGWLLATTVITGLTRTLSRQ